MIELKADLQLQVVALRLKCSRQVLPGHFPAFDRVAREHEVLVLLVLFLLRQARIEIGAAAIEQRRTLHEILGNGNYIALLPGRGDFLPPGIARE